MNPDLYDAWLTAGNNLQPAGDWLTVHAAPIGIAVALAFATWALRRYIRSGTDQRTRNDQAEADRITSNEDRPEPGLPGHDNDLLDECHAILRATNTRKEKPQP